MAILLNIETATEVCSVALASGSEVLAFRESRQPNLHSSHLTVFIQEILAEANAPANELQGVAVSIGPGSYTGLRIGLSTAKGLCYALNIPLISVPTLLALANGAIQQINSAQSPDHPITQSPLFCPLLDARRMEVYSAFYSADGFVYRDVQADIIEEGSYRNILEDHTVYFFGNGMPKCRPILEHPNARFLEDIFPSARFMAELSGQQFQQQQFADLAYTEPLYLKEFLTKPPRPLL